MIRRILRFACGVFADLTFICIGILIAHQVTTYDTLFFWFLAFTLEIGRYAL